MDNISRSHRSNNYGTLHGTVSLLLELALIYDDSSTSDLRSAAAAYAASVPPNNQTINQPTNQSAKRTCAIQVYVTKTPVAGSTSFLGRLLRFSRTFTEQK